MTTSRLYMLAILLASSALHALAAAVIVPLTSAADICYGSGFVCLSGATLTPGAPTITQGDGSGVPVTDQTSTSPISLSGFSTTLGPFPAREAMASPFSIGLRSAAPERSTSKLTSSI